MPAPTGGKGDFDIWNPSLVRTTHEHLRMQCVMYLKEHWKGTANLRGPSADFEILKKFCPEIVLLLCQFKGPKCDEPTKQTFVDFNSDNAAVSQLVAERINFKFRGRRLVFVASNL